MKRSNGLSRFFWAFLLWFCSFSFCSSALAFSHEGLYSQRDSGPSYYEPEHFIWIHAENDRLKQEDLLPSLSRQHVLIVLEQPDDAKKRSVRAFLQKPLAKLPEIDTVQLLPPPRTDEGYAIGYIEDRVLELRLTAAHEFEAYLVTFKNILRLATLLRTLDDLAKTPHFDFVLPVLVFSDKMAAPFIQFQVEFVSPVLIPGGIGQIKKTNRMNFVKETQNTSNFKDPVVLQLKKDAPTNILATVLRYQQMPWIVKSAKLRWLRVRMPIEVHARWKLPLGINSFSIWEPIEYVLYIERDQDVELLPRAFTEGTVRAWISENTRLPDDLIQVDHIAKQTQKLGDGRVLDEVSVVFRLSKTGMYIFSPYPIQATYQTLDQQRRIEVFRGQNPTFLAIPGHLPKQLSQIPGQLISLTDHRLPFWIAPGGVILGILLMVVGLVWTLRVSGWSFGFSAPGQERGSDSLEQTLEPLILKYRAHLNDGRRMLESLTFQGNLEREREWLRFLSVFLKRVLGERWYHDEAYFLGGLGASSGSIRRYMLATSVNLDEPPIAETLNLLQALEAQVHKKAFSLSRDDAKDLLAKTETIIEETFR